MNAQTVLSNLLTGCVVAIVVYFLNRKQNKATTLFNSTSAYSIMLNDLKTQIDLQAKQIVNLESKLNVYQELINNYVKRETEYLAQINRLENQLKIARKVKNENHT